MPILTRLPRRAWGLALVAAVLASGAVVLLLGGCGSSTAQAPAQSSRTLPLETIFEAQSQLFANPAQAIDQLRQLGVDDVKVFMPWGPMTPGQGASRTRPAHFDAASPASYPPAAWAPYDAIVRAAAARGVGVDLALEAPAPLWATAPGVPPGTASSFVGAWEPSAEEYGLFVQAVAKRYSGRYTPPGQGSPLPRVSFWSIWNEPNYGAAARPAGDRRLAGRDLADLLPATARRRLDRAC